MPNKHKEEDTLFWIITNTKHSLNRIDITTEAMLNNKSISLNDCSIIIPKKEVEKTKQINKDKMTDLKSIFEY